MKNHPPNNVDKQSSAQHFSNIAARHISRRQLLSGLITSGSALMLTGAIGCSSPGRSSSSSENNALLTEKVSATGLHFSELPHALDHTHHVAPGYRADILLRWGDKVFPDSPAFSAYAQDGEKQAKQFGNNNDFIGYIPLSDHPNANVLQHLSSANSERGLLCVNHEHTRPAIMFPKTGNADTGSSTIEIAADMAAHGHTIVEIQKSNNGWQVVLDSPFNRRVTAFTPMRVSGPVAGHKRLKTKADPEGNAVIGTFANCGGGITPWGTVLIAEENFRHYFAGDPDALATQSPREALMHKRFDIGAPEHYWHLADERFNINAEPHEPNRYGWIVEINPFDPNSVPIKRTALGRCQHEAATVVAEDGKPVVVYSGDDSPNEYIYRFVSDQLYNASKLDENSELLDQGTLYVAKFHDDDTGSWLPLKHGEKGLTEAGGFASQADILIDVRLAADAVGATKMDRPEDVESNPLSGRVYVSLTKNTERETIDAANPRNPNLGGHIVEMIPPGADGQRDHWSNQFSWNLFLLAGNPQDESGQAGRYAKGTSEHGWFCNPDNFAFDPKGRLWIATDGFNNFGVHDGLWATQTTGDQRAVCKHFFGCPQGAELCGPCFTPDGKTLFVAVQHPGDDDIAGFANPLTRWPDFDANMPPRASVVVITKDDGGDIGS